MTDVDWSPIFAVLLGVLAIQQSVLLIELDGSELGQLAGLAGIVIVLVLGLYVTVVQPAQEVSTTRN